MNIADLLKNQLSQEDPSVNIKDIIAKKQLEISLIKETQKLELNRAKETAKKHKYLTSKKASGFKDVLTFLVEEYVTELDNDMNNRNSLIKKGKRVTRSDIINELLKEKYSK